MSTAKRLLELSKKFRNTNYQFLLDEATQAYLKEDEDAFKLVESRFPGEAELLEKLVEKLEGKSVYTNLKKILKNESVSLEDQKIALSSLFTHAVIETRKNPEYRILEGFILNKINKLAKV